MEKLPLGVMLLICYCIIMGILQLLVGAYIVQGGMWGPTVTLLQLGERTTTTVSIGVIMILMSLLWFVLAIGLYRMEKWAFWLAIILLALSAPTLISLIFLIYLIYSREKFE